MQYDLTRNIPKSIQERHSSIPESITQMNEDELEAHFKPKIMLYQIKNRIWDEVKARTEDPNKTITMSSIASGVCSEQSLLRYMDNDYILAWFLTPMASYDVISNAVLAKATKRYEDLIGMDINVTRKRKNAEGEFEYYTEVDAKKADILLRAIQNIENRVLGTAIQKNINLSGDLDKHEDVKVEFSMDDVNKRIKELEEKLGGKHNEEERVGDAIVVEGSKDIDI